MSGQQNSGSPSCATEVKHYVAMQGHQLYYGPAQKVHMWFNQLGAPCPERVSIADFILDLASNDVVIGDRQVLSRAREAAMAPWQTAL